MPSRRAVIVSSCEPWASARSKLAALRPLAQRLQARPHLPRLAGARAAAVVADHGRRHPVRLDQLQRLRVVARGDLHLVALLLQQLTSGRNTSGCALAVMSIQTFIATASLERRVAADALDVVLVPEREARAAPRAGARGPGAPGDVLVEQPRHRRRLQVALPAERLGRQRLAGERLAARRAARPRPGSRSRACARARPRAAAAARPPCAAAASSRGRAPCAAPAARTRSSRRPCP